MYGIWNRLQYMLSPQFDIYEQISRVVSGQVVDIGSGTGFGTHLFTRNAEEVVGFEVDRTARDFAEKAFGNGNLEFREADITQGDWSPFSGPIDFVTMIDVIEHIEEASRAVANCKTLVSLGRGDERGQFICSTPNRLSRYRKSDYHVREYSPDEFQELLQGAFDDVQIVNYKLEPDKNIYINPMIGICR